MSNNESDKVSRTDCSPWHDADTVHHYYIEKEYSLKEVGETLGCAECTVLQWCRRHGIETRDPQEARDTGTPEDFKDEERMRELYLTLELTCAQIADHYDVTPLTVSKWLRRHNIPTRPRYEQATRETRICENCGDEFETRPKATKKYCKQACYFEDLDMPTGADHWSWNENRRHMQAGELWEQTRRECRSRDDYQCQICGVDEPDDGQHDVHHLIPVRYFEDSADAHWLGNVVTLCRSCHMQWERKTPILPCVVP